MPMSLKKKIFFFSHQTCTVHRHRHHPPSHSATTMKCIVDQIISLSTNLFA